MPTSNMQSAHMSPTHHNQQQIYNQSHYSTGTMTPIMHTTHHPSHFSGSTASASMSNIPVSVNVNQMPTSRSTTPAGYPPEEFYTAQDYNDLGQEHYIYVTYPPELKRRLLERYGREIYLSLLKKDSYD